MSAFLAPIHFWLFNKVKIHQGLEVDIENGLKAEYGDAITDIVNKNIALYGDRLDKRRLDEIIDEDNIHGWLQEKISIAETRQAGILKDIFDKFGQESIDIARNIFKQNAIKNAEVAKTEMSIRSPEDVYKAINNYILDGMPCDNSGRVTNSNDQVLESVQNNCLHIDYWNTVGLDADLMYELSAIWRIAFVSGLSEDFEYSIDAKASDRGSKTFYHKITRK